MIFITNGTQLPFDRLIKIIDELAPTISEEMVVQTIPGDYVPKNIKLIPSMSRVEFDQYADNARIIVGHAGMGTIITGLLKSKPVVIFPRIAAMGEHRNEHQMATTKKFESYKYVYAAYDADTLAQLLTDQDIKPLHSLGNNASPVLSKFVANFVNQAKKK